MNVAVIGTGYVGLVTGTCFAEFGVKVICVDKIKEKLDLLNQGEVPFYEPGLKEMVARSVKAGRLSFTSDIGLAIERSLVIFIAVGTPQGETGVADLSYVKEVAESIGKHINGYKVIVNKSTVPVGTGEIVEEIIKNHMTDNHRFSVISNPEFLREGAAIEDFLKPNRVVVGANKGDEEAVAIMKDLYSPLYLIETPFVITNRASAEMIKYAANAFLAVKISYINEVADLCERVGADVHAVAKGIGLDGRIGNKFLHPGPGFGGSCFPKDTIAFSNTAKKHACQLRIVDAAAEVNQQRIDVMIKKINDLMGDVKGKTLAILGVAFKLNTDDIRESPSLKIIKRLQEQGAKIRAYDPAAMENAKKETNDVIFCQDEYDCVSGSNAVVIITEWHQFRNLDLERVKELLIEPIFIDLRNIYEPHTIKRLGFKHVGVGRG
ncbi:MAG: UDP-glucose/GDP-mannose dehydrogenase family protein [bacterium]|nr:UDP-glucose/GDP-mannose dehydrogenase family protein [bacterium]